MSSGTGYERCCATCEYEDSARYGNRTGYTNCVFYGRCINIGGSPQYYKWTPKLNKKDGEK